MQTTEIRKIEAIHPLTRRFNIPHLLKQLLGMFPGVLLAIGLAWKVPAQTVYSVNIVGCVPDMTIYLLTTPMTTAERQVLHTQNFKQLAPSLRPLYLHAVAYSVAFSVASNGAMPTSIALTTYLQSIVIRGDLCAVPEIPAEYSQLVGAEMFIVNTGLKELNLGIASQIAASPLLQQTMHAGAINGFFDIFCE